MKGKRALSLVFIMALMLTLSGCNGSTDGDKAVTMMGTRAAMNIQALTDLHEAGLLGKEAYDRYVKTIQTNMDTIGGYISNSSVSKIPGITEVYTAGEADGFKTKSDSFVDVLTSSDTGAADLMKEINYPVWVLNPDKYTEINNASSGAGGAAGIAVLQEYINAAKTSGDYSKVKNYFTPSGYTIFGNKENGGEVDPFDKETGLFIKTDAVTESEMNGTTSGINEFGKNMVLETSQAFRDANSEIVDGKPTGRPGPNISHRDFYFAMQIQLVEFNRSTVDRLTGGEGINSERFILVPSKDGSAPIVLLMEYPVDAAFQFSHQPSEGTWEVSAGSSELTYNLLTEGFRYRAKGADSSIAINWGSSGDVLYSGKSVKLIDETSTDELDAEFFPEAGGGAANSPGLLHFLLTDYLELEYMPGVVEGHNLVALGRMVRLTALEGKMGDEVGHFIGRDGNPISPTGDTEASLNAGKISIYSGDIVEAKQLENGTILKMGETVQAPIDPTTGLPYDPGAGGGAGATPTPTPTPSADPNAPTTGGGGTANLPRKTGNIIFPVGSFFNNAEFLPFKANTKDTVTTGTTAEGSNEVKPPPMYGIALECDAFATNLYSGWITSSNTTVGSLDWWDAFLEKAGFTYAVDRSALEEFLMGTYATELRKDGVIILDLETIGRIRTEYTQEDQVRSVTMFRSMFAFLGIILGAYGLLLMAAWALDVNLVGGPKLLTLLTFGRWIAVSNAEDIPYASTERKHYMSFGSVLWTAVGMIALGAVLGLVDVLELVNWFVQVLGKFAELIGSVFTR